MSVRVLFFFAGGWDGGGSLSLRFSPVCRAFSAPEALLGLGASISVSAACPCEDPVDGLELDRTTSSKCRPVMMGGLGTPIGGNGKVLRNEISGRKGGQVDLDSGMEDSKRGEWVFVGRVAIVYCCDRD